MNLGRTVFSQLIEHLPSKEFHKCVLRYRGDCYLKSFSCWDQFLSMAFAQLKLALLGVDGEVVVEEFVKTEASSLR